MKKFLKILGIVAATLFVVFVVALVLVIRALPSPSEIGRLIKPATVRTALKNPQGEPPDSPAQPPTEAASSDSQLPQKADSATTKSDEDKKITEELMDPRKPLAEFCHYLRYSSQSSPTYSMKEFGQKFKQSAVSEEKDPTIQAIKPSLRFIFSQPKTQEMVQAALDAADRGETAGLMEKAEFYSKAYASYRELLKNKIKIEQIMDRSYDLLIMSRVIAKKPELLSDNHVADYCRSIETAINTDVPLSREEEKLEFEKFLDESGVDPKSVGYDPQYRTKLDVKYSATGLQLQGGWIDSVLKPTPQELRSIENQAQKAEKK